MKTRAEINLITIFIYKTNPTKKLICPGCKSTVSIICCVDSTKGVYHPKHIIFFMSASLFLVQYLAARPFRWPRLNNHCNNIIPTESSLFLPNHQHSFRIIQHEIQYNTRHNCRPTVRCNRTCSIFILESNFHVIIVMLFTQVINLHFDLSLVLFNYL